jgi:hypothetical protein
LYPGFNETSLIQNTVENSLKVYKSFILDSDFSVMPERLEASARVANLGDFSPKNAKLGVFLAFGELGDF